METVEESPGHQVFPRKCRTRALSIMDSVASPSNDEIAVKEVTAVDGTVGHHWKNSRRKPRTKTSWINKPKG